MRTPSGFFRRIEAIYGRVYGDRHYLVALAISNRASVYQASGQNLRAEPLFREAVARYAAAQGPTHTNTAIAHIKLGRSLLRQGKFAEARKESLAGYEVMVKEAGSGEQFPAGRPYRPRDRQRFAGRSGGGGPIPARTCRHGPEALRRAASRPFALVVSSRDLR